MNPEEILNDFMSRNQKINREKAKRIINEKFLAQLPLHVLEYCANYEIVQDKLLALTPTQLNILSKIIKEAEYQNQDWTLPAAEFITLIENKNYQKLVTSLEGNLLNIKEINALMFLTRNSFNYFGIYDYKDLQYLDAIREAKYEESKNNASPEIILLNKYGISFNTALAYLKRYGKDIDLLPRSEEKEFLQDIASIIKNEGTFDPISDNYELLNNLNSRLSNLFGYLYDRELYQLDNGRLIKNEESEGIEIPIYDAGVEFTMSIHSVGMASGETPKNYYESWNRPDASNSNFCNSIITSRSMRTSVKSCIFGFASYVGNDLKLLAANDLGTGGLARDPITSKIGHDDKLIAKVEYRVPSQMDNHTRFSNNEVYRSRRRVVNGRLEKVNPDYLVYLKESYDTDVKADPVWEQTIKASKDYYNATGKVLPIVVVECEKCLEYNVKKVEYMINYFNSSFDDKKLLVDIIELIHTLRMGHQVNEENIIEKHLNKEKCLSYFMHILETINRMSEFVPKLALEHLETLTETLDMEYAKMNASPRWIEHTYGTKTVEKNTSLYKIIEEEKKKIIVKLMKKQQLTQPMNGNKKM